MVAKRALAVHLRQITESRANRLEALKAGAYLVRNTGYSIDELVRKAVMDRHKFARDFLRSAERALNSAPPDHRLAVARAYYAMYHAVRAVVFIHHSGDDYQEHSKLPGFIPNDFPQKEHWENELKNARLERNKADYDPYPKNNRNFQDAAVHVVNQARDLLPMTAIYLKEKGYLS